MIPELETLYLPFVDAVMMLIVIIVLTRIAGLRSFSKMSGFDFSITVAFGSIIAATVLSPDRTFITGAMALAALFLVQVIVSRMRISADSVEKVVDNNPILIMDGPRIIEENLSRTKVTHSDLRAKLREANVLNINQVCAVVVETTGDVSVLHSENGSDKFSRDILEGVDCNGCN